MKILVCLKQVPDTGTRLQLKEDGTGVEESGIEWIINPYDEFALEEALRIKDKGGNNKEVVVLSQGPLRVEKALRQALAMGADKAYRIEPAPPPPYPAQTARALSHTITKEEPNWDMILTGKTGVDENHFATSPMLAECLNIPHVGFVSQLTEQENGKWLCVRYKEGGIKETITLSLPALFTVEKGINQPRYPSLPNIMRAKQKPIKIISTPSNPPESEPELANKNNLIVGSQGKVFFESYRLPDPPPSPHLITGSAKEQAKTLVCVLKEKQLI